ncbi:RNA polymerase sigma-B factor [Bacillus mesophilus]|uniref:RNA polymerase sigma factor SigB n=1 Tax=Bacillus mesophilus TaxID=1808955 RepID=A0A6M0QCB9_9BACI|nr:RNA polymerase sigma factor SigB [Bacillus mesophilus]MBM7663127.1 RNA polymerase sigma-B factor [Bacillus mesophilus]NEY73897.1 RNA polymerase sigma factor SigB [Bacillus mesophilus]
MKSQSQPTKQNNDIKDLIEKYQKTNDEDIQLFIVEKYRALVESLARKYSRGRNMHEDLVQVGMLGLLGAIRRYDPSVGKAFEAFAIPTIIGEIKRFLRDKTWSIHVPRRIKELGPRIKGTVEKLTTDLQRSPKIEEIARYLDVSEEEVLETMEVGKSYQALSVDHKIESDSDGSTVTLLDLVGNQDSGYELINQKMDFEASLKVLTERERQVIQYTFLENLSQKEAGEKLGISQMHVSRLQRRAIQKLRNAADEDPIQSECIT